jgi:hypothetical protein
MCEILDDSYDDDYSHAYIMMHQYFGKNPKLQKMNMGRCKLRWLIFVTKRCFFPRYLLLKWL